MRARLRLGMTAALITTAGLALPGMLAGPATAAAGHSAAVSAPSGQPVQRFNVGAAHSPRLLRQLATPAAAGSRATPKAAPIAGAVPGIDVASFQESPAINWSAVASSGVGFAAVKATEGDYYQNPFALKDLAAAKAAGLAVVGYAFGIPNGNGASASPVTQADDAIRYLRSGSAGVPPVMLDIEYNPYGAQCYGLTKSAMATWIEKFAAEVKARTGRPAILYTTTGWWSACVGAAASMSSSPLWIASFTSNSSPGTMPGPWPAGGWTYWQYSSVGTVPGVSGGTGNTDLDLVNPARLTFLNPGDQQDQAGTQIQPVQLHSSITGATFSSATLPAGLTLTSSGQITGTLAAGAGSRQVTVTATDPATQAQQSATFTWYRHGSLSIGSLSDRGTSVGRPVGLRLQVTDSPSESPVTYSAPVLPRGVSISASTGLLTGWPSKPGSYQVTVYAADRLEAASSASFTWTVGVAPGSGRSGPVRLGMSGKCLNDTGNGSADGTAASIWTCNGGAAQRWIHAQDTSLRSHGKCLTASANSAAELEPCTSDATQQWVLVYPKSVASSAAARATALYNPGSKQCLTDPRFSTKNGTGLVAAPCNGYRTQTWTLSNRPVVSGVPGKCLEDSRNRIANGNKIESWNCNGSAGQLWTAGTDSTLRFRNHCLNVAVGARVGSRVTLRRCSGGKSQKWQVRDLSGGIGAELVNPASGKCLAIPRDSAGNGIWLVIDRCDQAHPGMQWRF